MRFRLRRANRRCRVHDPLSAARIRQLEQQLGLPPSEAPGSFVEAFYNPALIDCGHRWCKRRR